jgi:hypothetical protein
MGYIFLFIIASIIAIAISREKTNNMFESGDIDISITNYFDLGKTVPTRFKATSEKIYIGNESLHFKDIIKASSYSVKNRYRVTRSPYVSNPYKEATTYYLVITYMSKINTEQYIQCYSFKFGDSCMYNRIADFINKKVKKFKNGKLILTK